VIFVNEPVVEFITTSKRAIVINEKLEAFF